MAVPADRRLRYVVQPDGTQVAVRLCGDEHFHYHMTEDDVLVEEAADGGWYYLTLHDGKIVKSSVLSHGIVERDNHEVAYLKKMKEEGVHFLLQDSIRVQWKRAREMDGKRMMPSDVKKRQIGVPSSFVGKRKGLVILVNFANRQMSSPTAHDDYFRMYNEPGYSENGHIGSVHDYFYDQSYGLFDLSFDVVGPVTVSRNYGYYGTNGTSGNTDMHADEMVREACRLASANVDFKDYDWDGDGVVEQVFLVYAGFGEATGGPANTIWPHRSLLSAYSEGSLSIQGVQIDQYACCNELSSYLNKYMGIGTACHEFSHCLGLPDIYDVDYAGGFGMSYWDVMHSGSYSGPDGIGEVPCGYSAYERWFAGWLQLTEISSTCHVESLKDLGEYPQAYILYNEGNRNEYFILENRQGHDWFSFLDSDVAPHGMLVTHVDYDRKAWSNNTVNTKPDHQRLSLIPADGIRSLNTLESDLFPGSRNVTRLTNTSHSESGGTLYNVNTDGSFYMNKEIRNIVECDGEMAFDVICNDELPVPEQPVVSDVTSDGFSLEWEPVEKGEYYMVELAQYKSLRPIIISNTVEYGPIEELYYQLSGLDGKEYGIRICAILSGGIRTEWSSYTHVSLPANGIREVPYDDRQGHLYYNLDGTVAKEPLMPGIYIKRKSGGGKKILIK